MNYCTIRAEKESFRCHECGGAGDRISLVSAEERTCAVTCTVHNRYERISWDVAVRDYPEEIKRLRRRIEDRLRKDVEFLLRAADALDS